MDGRDDLMPIGAFARRTGLSPRALRLYETMGLLRPESVDPANGYRYYTADQLRAAEAIRRMRAIGMPLRAIAGVLTASPSDAHRLVDAHWAEVESRLAETRAVVSSIHALIDETEEAMSATLSTQILNDALDRVLFAAGTDPKRPLLGSVLVRGGPDDLRLVATDSYRLVECIIPSAGFTGDLLIHRDNLAELAASLDEAAELTLQVVEGAAVVSGGKSDVRVALHDGQFPNYEALIEVDVQATLVASRDEMLDIVEHAELGEEVGVDLVLGDRPSLNGVRLKGRAEGTPLTITLNAQYLADGLRSVGGESVVIEADSDRRPVRLTPSDGSDYRYLLMPIRRA